MTNPIQTYLTQLQANLDTDQATEHTHRAALGRLIETLAPNCNAINEPKQIACGSPDFVVLQQSNNAPVGYIEAKDIGISLNNALKSEQLQRYLPLGNVILTDYLTFRWFVEEQERDEMQVTLAKIDKNKQLIVNEADFARFERLIEIFVNTFIVTLNNPDDLAQRMAKIARLINSVVLKAYENEDKNGKLHKQLDGFRKVLFDGLQSKQFADMYAQTVCYGLFAARCHVAENKPFIREAIANYLPKTNPFLRKLFDEIAGIDLDDRLVWAVENLTETLKRADIAAILADFGKRTRQEDPVVHFYETFLKHYDPTLREMRGVYYTPEPVVSYIVRSVDLVLKQQFNLKEGLADNTQVEINGKTRHKVQILDPAVGTGTFLYAVVNKIYEKFARLQGMWSDYVHQHLLPRLHGFELLIAPYTVAHMKLGILLQEKGYDFASEERLQLFLTNTLDKPHDFVDEKWAAWLSEESNAAMAVKQDIPVMVIVGNPPYSGHSANKGEWISDLIHDRNHKDKADGNRSYFKVDGESLNERNPKWLNDDYVKFIRFSQWRIDKTGLGILGFVTNHGYLDNPTFRGMRQSLLKSFDEIYIYDLHGNAKKKEKTLDGDVDNNVFDIQQGVAIGIFVKNGKTQDSDAKVFHADLYGKRTDKYQQLEQLDINNTQWTELTPSSPFYLFVPQNIYLLTEYEQNWKVTEIMPINSVGVVTARDKLTIHDSEEKLLTTIEDFTQLDSETARLKYNLGQDVRDWKVELAQQDLQAHHLNKKYVRAILYRPFDIKYTFYTGQTRGFHCMPRYDVMQHMLLGDNLGLITIRRSRSSEPYRTFFVANTIISGATAISSLDINYFFPLYLYPTEKETFLNGNGNGSHKPKPDRKPNFSPEFIEDVENRLNLQFIVEGAGDFNSTISTTDVFYYIYAIFHSPTYRTRYAEFLKMDFPRLPLTSDKKLFQTLSKLGQQLVDIHLMKADIKNDCGYPVVGDNIVDKPRYDDKKQRIYINRTQYFDNVKSEVWHFYIGGYQVCHKWLKDRKGRELKYEDLKHYLYILAALEQTNELMQEIDENVSFPLE
jgi:predicted helicase